MLEGDIVSIENTLTMLVPVREIRCRLVVCYINFSDAMLYCFLAFCEVCGWYDGIRV